MESKGSVCKSPVTALKFTASPAPPIVESKTNDMKSAALTRPWMCFVFGRPHGFLDRQATCRVRKWKCTASAAYGKVTRRTLQPQAWTADQFIYIVILQIFHLFYMAVLCASNKPLVGFTETFLTIKTSNVRYNKLLCWRCKHQCIFFVSQHGQTLESKLVCCTLNSIVSSLWCRPQTKTKRIEQQPIRNPYSPWTRYNINWYMNIIDMTWYDQICILTLVSACTNCWVSRLPVRSHDVQSADLSLGSGGRSAPKRVLTKRNHGGRRETTTSLRTWSKTNIIWIKLDKHDKPMINFHGK